MRRNTPYKMTSHNDVLAGSLQNVECDSRSRQRTIDQVGTVRAQASAFSVCSMWESKRSGEFFVINALKLWPLNTSYYGGGLFSQTSNFVDGADTIVGERGGGGGEPNRGAEAARESYLFGCSSTVMIVI